MSANEGDWISAKFHLMNTFNLHAKRGFGLYSHNLLSYDWDYVNVAVVVVVVGHVHRLQRLRPEIDTKRCVFNELTKKEKACLPHKPKKNREREKKWEKEKGKGSEIPSSPRRMRCPTTRGNYCKRLSSCDDYTYSWNGAQQADFWLHQSALQGGGIAMVLGWERKKKKTENRNGNTEAEAGRKKNGCRQTYLQFPQLKYPTLEIGKGREIQASINYTLYVA